MTLIHIFTVEISTTDALRPWPNATNNSTSNVQHSFQMVGELFVAFGRSG